MQLTPEQIAYMESLNHLPPGSTARRGVTMPEQEYRRYRDMHLNLGHTGWGTVLPTDEHLKHQRELHTYLLNTYCLPTVGRN